MKTRIQMIAAGFVLVIGASMAAWSQQAQADNSQAPRQDVARDHTQTNMTAQASTPVANSTTHKSTANSGAVDSIDVVGHLALPGVVVTNLRTTEDTTLHLLVVTDSTTHTLNFVDVADPNHPTIVQRIQKPVHLENSRLEIVVGHAALFAETLGATARPARRTISIVSFDDPEIPTTVREFANVSSLLADRARGLIYIANPEGLWVLQTHSVADRAAQEKEFDQMLKGAHTP